MEPAIGRLTLSRPMHRSSTRLKTVRLVATILAAVPLIAVAAGSSTAQASTGVVIANHLSTTEEMVLDLLNHSTQSGAEVALWGRNGGANQRWNINMLTLAGQDSIIQLVNVESGECLSAGGEFVYHTVQMPCDPKDPTEQFSLIPLPDGFDQIAQGDQCLDLDYYKATYGSEVGLFGCEDILSQEWNIH
jgi:hypothetical protein